jgi:hypothetical protein
VNDEIKNLTRERDYWMRVASYLASLHAATLSYDGTLKSCSRSRRDRYESIVETAADMMAGRDWKAGISYAKATPEKSRADCLQAIAYLKAET